MVVRNLINEGFDVQAKNILRSIDEHAYTIFLLAIRPELADDFVLTNDDESANRFWWKHIRGCREVVDKAIGSLLQERDVLRDNVFRTEESDQPPPSGPGRMLVHGWPSCQTERGRWSPCV